MPLRRLFHLIAALLMGAMLLLLAWVGWQQGQALQRAQQGAEAVRALRLSMLAAEKVSRERGPTNGLLGADLADAAPRQQALAQARLATDRAFDALGAVLASDSPQPGLRDAAASFALARQSLARARAAVDRTAALPLAQRPPEAIRDSVRAMVAVVPQIAPATAQLISEGQQALPALGDLLANARLAGELREVAGLLGSLFTPALAARQPFAAEERDAIERTRGRIDELRFLLELRLAPGGASGPVAQAGRRLREVYFGEAVELLSAVIATGRGDGRFSLDTTGFAARYVPLMDPILALRDRLLDEAEAGALAARAAARQRLVAALAGSLLLAGLLGAALWLMERRLLQPLARATAALQAMAPGPQAARPAAGRGDEVAAVVGAVDALQAHERERQALARERDELIERLREQSNTDFLTGLPNRRAFFAAAERELALALRHGHPVTAVLLDIDDFKRINDSVGHAGGDQVLVAVALAVRQALRQGDLVARFGGEEFVVLLIHCALAQGLVFAERLRALIAASPVRLPGQAPVAVTASFGVADTLTHGGDLGQLLSRADLAMYDAKRGGRNRVAGAPAA